jgi:hypothetical protein
MLLNVGGVDEEALETGDNQEQGDVAQRRYMMRWWMIHKTALEMEKMGSM